MTFSIKKLAILFSLFGMTACTYPSSGAFHNQMRSLYGKPVDVLVPSWGAPMRTHRFQDGRTLYEWHQQSDQIFDDMSFYPGTGVSAFSHWPSSGARVASYGGHGDYGYGVPFYTGSSYAGSSRMMPYGYFAGTTMAVNRPMVLEHHCTLSVITDAGNRIIQHQAVGDNCLAYEAR